MTGDSTKITVNATDNGGSGIALLSVTYESPISKKWRNIRLNNVSGDKYEGTLDLSDTDELGLWKIRHNHGNIINSGIVTRQGLWTYYLNTANEGKLSKSL